MDPVTIVGAVIGFSLLDIFLGLLGIEGRYYAVHALHNAVVAYATAPNVFKTLTDFGNVADLATPAIASEFIVALHMYHIVMYFKKLRYDDWLHHALMIGVALPLGLLLPNGSLMGYSLFFTTGLPGGIDYVLLALVRNERLPANLEKQVNHAIQVWVRSPGCVSFAAFVCAYATSHPEVTYLYVIPGLITAALNYWNGQYFMSQVVYDAGKRHIFDIQN